MLSAAHANPPHLALETKPMSVDDAFEHRKFRAEELLRMVEAGIFDDDDHIELVRGEILTVAPQSPEHGSIKDELHVRLVRAYAALLVHILDQRPIQCGPFGLPEPDLAVVHGQHRDYLTRHPLGSETLLVIELAKTSQVRDRAKAEDYARGSVPTYWLVDFRTRVLELHTDPDPELGRYRRVEVLDEEQSVALPGLEDVRFSVRSLLP